MPNWQNLSMRYKNIAPVAMAFAVMVGYSAIQLFGFVNAEDEGLQRLQNLQLPQVQQLVEANGKLAAMDSLMQKNRVNGTAIDAQMLKLYQQSELALGDDDGEQTVNAKIMLDQYFNAAQAFIFDNSVQRYGELQLAYSAYGVAVSALLEARVVAFGGAIENTRAANESLYLWGAGILFLIAVAIFAFGWFLTSQLMKGISYSSRVTQRIASGDLSTPVVSRSTDELGQLLQGLESMQASLLYRQDQDQRSERKQMKVAGVHEALRGDNDMAALGRKLLSYLAPQTHAEVGALYIYNGDVLRLVASHAYTQRKGLSADFALGESVVGQAALEQQQIILTDLPDDYVRVRSGLGDTLPRQVVVTPITFEGEIKGVLELASLQFFGEEDLELLNTIVETLGVAINTSEARVKVAAMLEESQSQRTELEQQQALMEQANADLEEQAQELYESEAVLQRQQAETQAANAELEAQAEQLRNSQQQLQAQQEELRVTNEELEEQTRRISASEERLQAQQEELRVTNEELVEQADALATQKEQIEKKNQALMKSGSLLEDKANQLEMSSRYKSEFLSTMSHELRTPLNSILILSNTLAENKADNLSDKQIEHAEVIHSAGSDLLALINDILDLSKVEEGKLQLVLEDWPLTDIKKRITRNFQHVAASKNLQLEVEIAPDMVNFIHTDSQRLDQILRNLLSNAFKFTQHGGIYINIARPSPDSVWLRSGLDADNTVAFLVRDTGIGIPEEKRALIFEAFQQADGTTSRKYGGTGLGLTISRELTALLGGELQLINTPEDETGSCFALYLPEILEDANAETIVSVPEPELIEPERKMQAAAIIDALDVPDLSLDEKSVLIVEDDNDFARVLKDLAEDYGLKGAIAVDGESGLEYARNNRPGAILLDIGLPGIDGWTVMEHLKQDVRTCNIPVHILSGTIEKERGLELGAVDFLTKPVSLDQLKDAFGSIESAIQKNVRRLLIVEDNEQQHEHLKSLFDSKGIDIDIVTTGAQAIAALAEFNFDCMVLDLTLPDMSGFELLELINEQQQTQQVPVIVYTAKDMTREEEARLRKYVDRIIIKSDRSSERLLSEASLFLHWLGSKSSDTRAMQSETAEHREQVFAGKRLLLVDDDMRNIYSLSAILEDKGVVIRTASNGVECLSSLEEDDNVDLVLMDIMMPEMDGYEAMQEIRKQDKFAKLPIIALTAKAMKDDRAKCLDAGANDYISKPIDTDRLFSLLRVWLHN